MTGSLLVVASEPSADRAAARVVSRLQTGGVEELFGFGGAALAERGVALVARCDQMASMGITEPLLRVGRWAEIWCDLKDKIVERRPAAALLVDGPDFNLPLARFLKEQGIPVVYYIGPQVWAWRSKRLELMRRRVHHAAIVLPFEKALYDGARVPATYVGHPLLDEPAPKKRTRVRKQLGLRGEDKLVALLPGSRAGEVGLLGPPMERAAGMLRERGIQTAYLPAPGVEDWPSQYRGLSTRDLLGAADGAVVASGTATLEAVLLGVPLVAAYKMNRLNWHLARVLVDVPYISLPNWICGAREIVEILQDDVTGERVVQESMRLLRPEEQERQRALQQRVRAALGGAGAARRVANIVAELMDRGDLAT